MRKAASTSKLKNYVQFDTISPATKLLEKRRKMYEVHEAFEAQKDEFKKQEEIFKRQEEEIKERDLEIQENLIKFTRFLFENEQKKKRAAKRLEDEKKACNQKDEEIRDLNAQISELVKLHNKLESKLSQLKQYEEYLEKVQKMYSDQYNDKGDILSRYKTLISSNIKLSKNHTDLESMLEQIKVESNHFEKEKNNEIIQLNNDIKDLLKKKEEKELERSSLLTQVEQKSSEASSKTMNLGKILMAIDNLYSRCSTDEIAKIRYDFEDFRRKQQFQKKQGLTKKEKKEREEILRRRKNEDTENYKAKGEIAIAKLKAIVCYLVDFERLRLSAVEVVKLKKSKN